MIGLEADFKPSVWSQSGANAQQSGLGVDLSGYAVAGRWNLDPADPMSPAMALSWHQMDISTSDPALPERLVDISIAGSMAFELEGQDRLQVTVGGGYAGDNVFDDGRAYYGLADLIYTKPIDRESGYQFFVSYNGNRSFLPDIPLPGFAYYDVIDEKTRYTVGIPASTITHKLDDRTTISATYFVPIAAIASIEHKLDDSITLFGRFDGRTRAYTLDSSPDNRRLFFQQRRVEAGLTWRDGGADTIEVTLAGGYAFDQEFTRGWDTRDDDTVRDLSDEPYFRVGVGLRF